MKVLIAVTHLLGTGHLARSLTLARAFQAAGWQASVASGGLPAPQLDRGDVPLIQLPPLQSDGVNFTWLLDADGIEAADDLHSQRQQMLEGHLCQFAPDVLITELYPFGRRVLRDEFLSLLNTAQAMSQRPLICSSIRDILAPPSKPKKAVQAEDIISQFYDAVLVHADAAVTPLDLSWPVTPALQQRLHYTGFVAPPAAAPHPDGLGNAEILISAGGGDVGAALFQTALQAAIGSGHTWRLLVGGASAAEQVAQYQAAAPANVIIEPARPDFRGMLYHAAASVSMCGYNTALDLLQSGCPAVIVPFDAGGEVEQTLRAKALAQKDGFRVITTADLTPARLLIELAKLGNTPRRAPATTGLDGANQTVRIVSQLRGQMT